MTQLYGVEHDEPYSSDVELSTLPAETLEQKIDRIDHNMTVLLETVQQAMSMFEGINNSPMGSMFMKMMGKKG